MIRQFKFADIVFQIQMPDDLSYPDNIRIFECTVNDKVDFYYELKYVYVLEDVMPVLNKWKDSKQYKRNNMIVFQKDNLECRILFFDGSEEPYAISEEVDETYTNLYYFRKNEKMLIYDTIFASMFSFERKLLLKDAMILHCAYIKSGEKAILFSAPSGTGKSTQADLWEKYRGTKTINGDAAIIRKRDDTWYANGWSVCGSSDICYDESYPVHAIVMLYQSKINTCRRLTGIEIIKKLFPQLKVNMWNEVFQSNVFILLDELVKTVPVFQLGCNISEDAVVCLEDMLNLLEI